MSKTTLHALALASLAIGCGTPHRVETLEPARWATPRSGLVCESNDACAEERYCDLGTGASCGADGRAGLCTVRPQSCGSGYSPVCGCDGRTYRSACAAAAEGVSVRSTGACFTGILG